MLAGECVSGSSRSAWCAMFSLRWVCAHQEVALACVQCVAAASESTTTQNRRRREHFSSHAYLSSRLRTRVSAFDAIAGVVPCRRACATCGRQRNGVRRTRRSVRAPTAVQSTMYRCVGVLRTCLCTLQQVASCVACALARAGVEQKRRELSRPLRDMKRQLGI